MFKYLTSITLLFFGLWAQAQNHAITLKVEQINTVQGDLHIGLYNKKAGFPDVDKTFKHAIVQVTDVRMEITFENLPTGEYSISLFHDKNLNGVMDFNFLGMPVETYGFSNNVYHRISQPTYDETSFKLEANKNLTIKLR